MNYNVVVRVRNKPLPLVLNVKGEGYALSAAMLLELPDEGSLEMSPAGQNMLDFGQVCCQLLFGFSRVWGYTMHWSCDAAPCLSESVLDDLAILCVCSDGCHHAHIALLASHVHCSG